MTPRRCHYVLSTHWDREWYQTFQHFRYRLVQLLDRMLEAMRDGRLAGPFVADGQAIPIEDYLEVRPECRAEVERFAREGKLAIGPWYVMPDEFLPSGEALIRNLRLGRQIARALGGKPSDAGFLCDIFGHNSQMPQIFKGFGIPMAFVWRGTTLTDARHFIWCSPDGTELPTYRFGDYGYCDYAGTVRHAFEPGYRFDADQIRRDLQAFIEHEAARTEVGPILLFDGGDHQEWDPETYAVLRERMACPDGTCEIVHTDLDRYLAEVLPQAGCITPRIAGELREPTRENIHRDVLWLIPGVLSSRAWIKQENARCQTLLCSWAEPLSAFAHGALGYEYPQGFLDVAWRWLLQNHPHDSICGCSIDAVHEDMKYRFSQCRQIAGRLATEAAHRLAAHVEGELAGEELRLAVFNPLPRPVARPVELTLRIPADWPTFAEFFGFEAKPSFRIYDTRGAEIPYQRLAQAMNRPGLRTSDHRFPEGYRAHDVRVSLPLALPALGYVTLTVRVDPQARLTRYPEVPGLATSERSMANEHLSVAVEPNGTLTLTDKHTGETYTRLLTFEDAADIGDGWYHGLATNDQVFVSTAARAEVALVHNGPWLATFRVRTAMRVPAAFDFDRMARSEEFADLVVDSLITLRQGADWVEVETTIHNAADDHRLRVLLPSGAAAQTYLADSPFDVVLRPIALRADNHLYRELELETRPQQSWTAVFDDRRGLAVVSASLMESAVRDLPERPIALTLFRGTRRTVGTTGEPGGQLRGPMTFGYWIVPLRGAPDRARLFDLAGQLAAGFWSAQVDARDLAALRGSRCLLPSASFLHVDVPAIVTSVRLVGDGLEVRLFNPTDEPIAPTLESGEASHFAEKMILAASPPPAKWPEGAIADPRQHCKVRFAEVRFATAQRVDLESRPIEPPQPLQEGRLALALDAKQIVTICLKP